MIETTIYKCEYCGAEFDDEYEADCHEWVCRYANIKKQTGSCLGLYREDGTELSFNDADNVWSDLDDAIAFTVGNKNDIQFIVDIFDAYPIGKVFNNTENNNIENLVGLWYFDVDNQSYGKWVRVDDQIKKWTYIKNKFTKDA